MNRFFTSCLGLLLLTAPLHSQSLNYDPDLKPFYHGVASGDPLPDRVIIWSRVTPSEGNSDDIDVAWQVATDSAMTNVVQSGLFTTNAARDYTVKVDVTGLQPYTTYFYRFSAGETSSMIGRTRTAPTADEADRLRFAVVSCSNYQAGYFSAYQKIAERADLDAVVHLGDYIYEYSASGSDFYGDEELRANRSHVPDKEIVSLEDYRTRYAQYRLDPDLRAVHQQHPFITIWDDHESANDGYKDGAQNHQPETEGPWSVRKSVSKQAYQEWLPIRVDLEKEPLYRTIHYGNLVDLIMLDTRLEEREIQKMSVTDPDLYSADRTILGEEQKEWLYDQLTTSEAKWKVIGNQVIFSPFNVWFAGLDPNGNFTTEGIESLFLDIWDGYPAERDEIINFIGENQIGNTVILTGDFHSSFAYDVTAQPSPLSGGDPTIAVAKQVPVPVTPTYDPATHAGSVAVEFATPSVNSANFDENIGRDATLGFEAQINNPLPAAIPQIGGVNPNPHMRYNDLDEHGYYILDVAEGRAQANWYYVNTILQPNSDEYFAAAWGTNDGENFLTEGEENAPKDYPTGTDAGDETFTLQLLHASDLEGGVEAIDNAPNFAALVDGLEDEYDATVRISAGDNYIPGPFFNAAADGSLRPVLQNVYQDLLDEPGLTNLREGSGRVDIAIANVLGIDASAVGNHEFDAGPDAFSGIIGTEIRGETLGDVRALGARFPYLSANLDFSAEGSLSGLFTDELLPSTAFVSPPDDLAAAGDAPKLALSTFIEVGGERIGVVGATTQILASITSEGDVTVVGPNTNDMPALAEILQPEIDRLREAGINKIIVTSHLQQLALEQALIGLLSGVDIIIAGGSDPLLAQEDDVLFPGEMSDGPYPIVTTNADGDPAAVVGTPGEYSYLGRLIAEFDAQGVLLPAWLANSDNGVYAALPAVVAQVWGDEDPFAEGSKAELVSRLTEAVSAVVTEQDGNVFGRTAVYLEGRREQVRTEETNLGNLTADANLFAARQTDADVQVSIKNGGGIRAAIGQIIDLGGGEARFAPPQANPVTGKEEGEVSQLDIVNALRFNNGLTLLTLSVADLKAVLEHGVSATTPGATPGQFPQVGGLRFAFDTTAAAGSRVQFVALINDDDTDQDTLVADGEIVGDADRMIRTVTLNFLADGGDNYPFPALADERVDLAGEDLSQGEATFAPFGTEQDALAEYLAANFSDEPFAMAETPPAEDTRIVNLRAQTVEPPVNRVVQIILRDRAARRDVGPLTNGDTIDLRQFPRGFTLRAETEGKVQSVQLILNDTLVQTENFPPYTLKLREIIQPGDYEVVATAYTRNRAEGTAGEPLRIAFVVADEPEPPLKAIVETAQETNNLSQLVRALQRAKLVDALNSEGPFTVFAPTDEAFDQLLGLVGLQRVDQLPPFILRQLLLLHVAKGELTSDQLAQQSRVNTLVGLPLFVRSDGPRLKVNNADVIAADVLASNGVIHLVDEVILPDLRALLLAPNERRMTTLYKSLLPTDEPLVPALTLTAYPNPQVNEIAIQAQGMAGETLLVAIIDPQGRYVARQELVVSGPQDELRLDMSSYAPGTYIVNAQGGGVYNYVRVVR